MHKVRLHRFNFLVNVFSMASGSCLNSNEILPERLYCSHICLKVPTIYPVLAPSGCIHKTLNFLERYQDIVFNSSYGSS